MLTANYRSHPALLAVPNERFYAGRLRAEGNALTTRVLEAWGGLPARGVPLIFHAVRGENVREASSPSWFNADEAALVVDYVCRLHESGAAQWSEIGVIAPYRKQVAKIRKALELRGVDVNAERGESRAPRFFPGLRRARRGVSGARAAWLTASYHCARPSLPFPVLALPLALALARALSRALGVTVGSTEQFQGSERKCIILSTVRSDPSFLPHDQSHGLGFVANAKRFNVALTRAQALLIVVGNPDVLGADPNWCALLRFAQSEGAWCGGEWHDDAASDGAEDGGAASAPRDSAAAAAQFEKDADEAEALLLGPMTADHWTSAADFDAIDGTAPYAENEVEELGDDVDSLIDLFSGALSGLSGYATPQQL